MSSPSHPQPYFEHFGHPGAVHAPGVNDQAERKLGRILSQPVESLGKGILLRAPRAGYGKTHVLERVRQQIGEGHEFIPLRPVDGARPNPGAAIEDALRRLTRQLPASGGLTLLDIYSRHLFALGLRPLVISGEVPCQDREAAAQALVKRPVETFNFHHPQAVTAHWTRENFEVLGPRISLEISQETGCSLNQVAFWVAALFRFATASPEQAGRGGLLFQTATADAEPERFGILLALLARLRRIVLVVDDLEGVHGDVSGARAMAGFLSTIRQEAPRVDIVVSVNDDVWESAFVPALSGGLLDRLSEVVIRLDGLDDAGVIALLQARGYAQPEELARHIAGEGMERHARAVLRRASEMAPQLGESQGS
ncbi:hypothetical protein HNR46_002668 [Haloferula luteola]|uniref:Uncharacterized protein n=1 Tax=Haloferula luteola TaxID=595692 RepID=A0A840V4E5_9BACT|nr:hypothetical protein [Haloferula luteola]MBB5352423.1 hypothetical protein [Haloferula luteola]